MKTKVIGLLIVAGGALFAQPQYPAGPGDQDPGYYPPQGSYESQGAYPPQAAYPQAPYGVAVRPPMPGPGYVWIDGYYDGYGQFIPGYWALPPYGGAFWIGPRFFGGRWSAGYWSGPRGFVGGYRGGFRPSYGGEFHSGVNERFGGGVPRAEFRGGGGQQFRGGSHPVQGGGRGGRPAQGGHGHR